MTLSKSSKLFSPRFSCSRGIFMLTAMMDMQALTSTEPDFGFDHRLDETLSISLAKGHVGKRRLLCQSVPHFGQLFAAERLVALSESHQGERVQGLLQSEALGVRSQIEFGALPSRAALRTAAGSPPSSGSSKRSPPASAYPLQPSRLSFETTRLDRWTLCEETSYERTA